MKQQVKNEKMFPLCQQSYTKINISVINPTEIKSTLSSYTVYTLKGSDENGPFQISRRYSQFDIVRQHLLRNWPGCFVPPLPEKKIINKGDQEFIEHRKIQLEHFCIEISMLQHLWFSQQFQIFLRNKTGDLQSSLKALNQDSCQSIIKKYDQKLINLRGKTIDTIVLNKVLQFQKFLKRVLTMMNSFKEMVYQFLEAKNSNYQQYSILYNYLLPEYEKCCLSNYLNHDKEGKIIFTQQNDEKLIAFISKIKDIISRKNFNCLLLMIQKEEREINAFLEVYRVHASYQKKISELKQKQKELELELNELNLGKQSIFKSIFKGNIEENKKNIERSINVNKQFINTNVLLSDMITLLLGIFEIDRFKVYKLQNYRIILKQIAITQVEFCRAQKMLAEHVISTYKLDQK